MDTSGKVWFGSDEPVRVLCLPTPAFWQQTSPAVYKLQYQTMEEEARFPSFSLATY